MCGELLIFGSDLAYTVTKLDYVSPLFSYSVTEVNPVFVHIHDQFTRCLARFIPAPQQAAN
jgi:hypothetical protein